MQPAVEATALTIRAEAHVAEWAAAIVNGQGLQAVPVVGIPEPQQSVKAAAGQHCSVKIEVEGRHGIGVCWQLPKAAATTDTPETDRLIKAASGL